MTLTLRKKIFSYKVQKMITTNRFVLFFQYNSITLKQWNILKNQILISQRIGDVNDTPKRILKPNTNSFKKTISMLVCKSKVLDEIHTPLFSNSHLYSAPEKKSLSLGTIVNDYSYTIAKTRKSMISKKKLTYFFSQGPTVLIAFNSIEIAKYICNILENGTKVPDTLDPTNLIHKIPLFTQTCNSIFKRRPEKESKSSLKNQLFFIGGLAENQIIDHLDLKALIELNPFLYKDLILKLYTPLMSNIRVLTSIKTSFVKTLNSPAINLINVLIFMKSSR